MTTPIFRNLARIPALAALALLAPTLHATGGKIVIKAGRIITQSGPDIQNGVIVIENGRITSVGADTKAPWDAEVLDHPELVAFPGFVEAHTSRGMDRSNENITVTPFLDVRDSIDPISFYFEDSLRAGITTINVQHGNSCVIGAQGMIVKPFGITIEQLQVRPQSGIKIVASPRPGASRALQAQQLRGAFADLRRYLEKLVQDTKDGKDTARREALFQGRDMDKDENKTGRAMEGNANWKLKGFEIVPRGEVDDKQEPLLRAVEGKLPVFLYCDSAASVLLGIDVARENGLLGTTTLVLDGDSWKAADQIAAAKLSVILSPELVYSERDPVTGKEVRTFVPGVFDKKGVHFALQSLNQSSQSLWFQAATCVAWGLDRKKALDAVTRVPAEELRLGKRVGSLEAGKDGNVLLLNGDPLSVKSSVQYVVLEGDLVYDRSKDVRVRQLIEGVEQNNTAPSGAVEPGDVCGDEHKEVGGDPTKKDPGEKKDETKPDHDHGGKKD
ncbi:MAG: hypothetical protein IPJ19_06940 [Planctomycetes bacterium]|nr:hypothetical protein [Planctomycetota bacterium]